jgi:hypothetical protein
MTSPTSTTPRTSAKRLTTATIVISDPPTPDEIRQAVSFMVSLGRPELQKALAQVIAGAIADTEHVAMQQFAATGEIDTEALLDELDHVEVPFEQEAWVDALARFVLFTSGGRQ